jgi:pimeloyl-ACP methyl ester carboxylesterase
LATTHSVFELGECSLHFRKSGNGSKTLLAFHGFGQNHEALNALAHAFQTDYTLYAFDLFFHGQSLWKHGENPLKKSFWKNLLEAFLNEEKIERFSLIGFSMGGKFALATLEAFPFRVDEMTLLAPDGIKTSFWYSLATYPLALRNLFKSMIKKPGRFHALASLAFKLRLIDKGILRFVESQMSSEEQRARVYNSWVVFRHLKFDLGMIANLINSHHIRLTIVVGRHDKIITARNMNRLLEKVNQPALEIIDSGHNNLISKWAAQRSNA